MKMNYEVLVDGKVRAQFCSLHDVRMFVRHCLSPLGNVEVYDISASPRLIEKVQL